MRLTSYRTPDICTYYCTWTCRSVLSAFVHLMVARLVRILIGVHIPTCPFTQEYDCIGVWRHRMYCILYACIT
ncbi:hypothetical protein I7I50_06676 [Histoplasma capsulatum G186AR]|uniref:Uncharacterized protein n=1 Tax=Ajellomyces capsulatus TaxID=5037 RepID=A0A8H7YZ71_AJECA|nr:hypothetical protein I7I52_10250 [Histoplasma capsulatum]QSS67557.1 hypothetical protein I7I50_06676 [Histoplasma capsulatum G186AR]